ncbi:hypothetical protein [uncultured Sphingomonas sp.]|uniref:hypothetical protein n=1 Tax=uncultured Sphingomonas sp. TaxID=158754 RepID=UPI0025D041F8|nr:hypothetical protein [uncultured Sphingomonas sp.]
MAELDATLSPDEFEEWIAFHSLEPFGSPVEDERARVSNTLFAHANFKEVPEWCLFDRDPEETARLKAKHTQDDALLAFFNSIAVDEA